MSLDTSTIAEKGAVWLPEQWVVRRWNGEVALKKWDGVGGVSLVRA